uniref:WD_REPEATS_REGION domain-containing protein n=1 Tax=Steinernema glaseri TaxID=37863 RepID=A0A1I7ZSY1_9BILA
MDRSRLAKLEKVLGCTACLSSVSVDEKTGAVAYPAGSTVVIYHPRTNSQAHLIGTTKSNITSLAFSKCGRFIVTGEYGHDPKVRVWDLYNREGQFCGQQLCELKEHKLGISCVRFSNDSKFVISVGNQHDKSVVVWDWRNGMKVAENRLTSQVNAMDVSENGQSFVTVGVRHVKFWYLPTPHDQATLQGRSAILADQRNNTFVDVCCAKEGRTFAITQTKLLVEFHDKKLVNVYELKKSSPYSLALGDSELFIGFENGTIRALDLDTLQQKFVFCNPHFLGTDVVNAQSPNALVQANHPAGSRYPHAYFILYHRRTSTMTAFYSDRSIFQWQLLSDGQITKVSSHLSHAGHIFDLQVVPSSSSIQAPGTFVTAGSDETIRIWNIEKGDLASADLFSGTNVFSQELKKIVYVGESNDSLIEPSEKTFGAVAGDTLDSRIGVRSLRVSPDGSHLASGTKDGNIFIYDFTTTEMEMIVEHDAHNSEVLCLQYSNPATGARYLFASGGRDRLVHLFDPLNDYGHLLTVDDHASSINAINFLVTRDGLDMYTCATDKLVVIRRVSETDEGVTCTRVNQFVSQCSLNDMVVSPEGTLVAACHDRQIRSFNTQGKLTKVVKGTLCEDGALTRLSLDPSGTFAAAVCSDRFVYLMNASTGECAAVLSGFSEPVTAISFTNDCRRIIAVSYSGCIFVWRLSSMLTKKMMSNLKRLNMSESSTVPDEPNERSATPDSLIESGSESASVTGNKTAILGAKDSARGASGSEFGSLTSVHIAAGEEDDLDSGVGGAAKQQMQHHQFQMPQVVIDSSGLEDKRAFEVKRVPADVVRRSTSGNVHQGSTCDLRATGNEFSDDESLSPQPSSSKMSATAGLYTSSRSMSNLHGNAQPPARTRRKWNVEEQNENYAVPQGRAVPPPQPRGGGGGFMTMNGTEINYNGTPNNSALQRTRNHDSSFMTTSSSLTALRSHLEPLAHSSPKHAMALPPTTSRTQTTNFPVNAAQASQAGTFVRATPERVSLTNKYLNSAQQPRSVFTPQATLQRKTIGSAGSATPVSSAIHRRQSEHYGGHNLATPHRMYIPNGSNVGVDDSRTGRKARSMNKLKSRRMTVSTLEHGSPQIGDCSSPLKGEDYASSELHMVRTRSQSPSQLTLQLKQASLNATADSTPSTRRDSDMSMLSSSRRELRGAGGSTSAANRLAEMRNKMRKSTENIQELAFIDEANSSGNSAMSRSRSIGNLKLSVAAGNLGSMGGGLNSEYDNDSPNSSGLLATSNRSMARSVTNLQTSSVVMNDNLENGLARQYKNTPNRSRFSQQATDLKKSSNPDLTNAFNYTNTNDTIEDDSFYPPTLSKGVRMGAVQKRVERNMPRHRNRFDNTTSGDSDSNASEFHHSPIMNINNPMGAGYRKSAITNRSVSSVEPHRPSSFQASRRVFDGSMPPRKTQNYIAQRYDGSELVGPDMGSDESPRSASSSHDMFPCSNGPPAFKTSKGEKMSNHVKDCLGQFTTALDKVLSARKMLEEEADLDNCDREILLRMLNEKIAMSRRRLDGIFDDSASRTCSETTRSESAASHRNGSSMSNSRQPVTSSGAQIDQNFLDTHGAQILALLQQRVPSKQN